MDVFCQMVSALSRKLATDMMGAWLTTTTGVEAGVAARSALSQAICSGSSRAR